MSARSVFFSTVLGLLLASAAAAQQVEVQAVKLTNGTVHHGRVTEGADSVSIELITGGTLVLPRSQIREIGSARGQLREGEFWLQDSNETRLLFAPTARTLPRGAGYVSAYMVVLPFVGYGVTESLTIAGGILPFFGGDAPVIGYFAPKLRLLDGDGVQAAIGGLSFFSSDASESVGIVYGVTSFGRSSDASVSLGAGFGYAGREMAATPVLMAGWERRTSRRTKLVGENWIFPKDGVILSAGPRFLGDRLSADFGLAVALFGDTPVGFPLINFVWNW